MKKPIKNGKIAGDTGGSIGGPQPLKRGNCKNKKRKMKSLTEWDDKDLALDSDLSDLPILFGDDEPILNGDDK